MKVLFIQNTSEYLYNLRNGIIKELINKGVDVNILAPFDDTVVKLEEMGCICYDIEINVKSKNPFKDIKILKSYKKEFKNIKPDIILSYTVKPNIYGSLAAMKMNIPIINNITGLGSVFIKFSLTTIIVRLLYKLSLRNSYRVFFQNIYDKELFLEKKIVKESIVDVLPGSGVDVDYYKPLGIDKDNNEFRFILIARMLYDKGIKEYIEAIRMLKNDYKNANFFLLGPVDCDNPTAIKLKEINDWENEGIIKYLGIEIDVRKSIGQADCVVLPSYREGTSRVLLEAAAMGKPLIATNVPGCNNVIEDGYNGFLCKQKNAMDLKSKIEMFLNLNKDEIDKLGRNSRKKIVKEFSEEIVIKKYMSIIEKVRGEK